MPLGGLTALLLLAAQSTSASDDAPMRFTPEVPGYNQDVNVLIGRGRITEETPAELARTLREIDNPEYVYWIAFDSLGGEPLAAIELGRLIRRENLRTSVLHWICEGEVSPLGECENPEIRRGRCESACAYAFFGGVERRLFHAEDTGEPWPQTPNENVLGFHQFTADAAVMADTSAAAVRAAGSMANAQTQVTASEIAQYIGEMGIDLGILVMASDAAPETMTYPPSADLDRLRVIFRETYLPVRIVPDGESISAVSMFSTGGAETQQLSFHCTPADRQRGAPRFVFSRAQVRHGRIWLTSGPVRVPAEVSSLESLPGQKAGDEGSAQPETPIATEAEYNAYAAQAGPRYLVYYASLRSGAAGQGIDGNQVRMFADANWSHIVIWPSREIMAAVIETGNLDVGFQSPNYTNLSAFPSLRFSEEDRRNIAAAVRPCLTPPAGTSPLP